MKLNNLIDTLTEIDRLENECLFPILRSKEFNNIIWEKYAKQSGISISDFQVTAASIYIEDKKGCDCVLKEHC